MEQKTVIFRLSHQSDISLCSMQFPQFNHIHGGTSSEMHQVPQAIFSLQPEKHALILAWKRWRQTKVMFCEFRPKSAAAGQCRWGGSSADEHTHKKRQRWILTARVQWLAEDMPSIISNQSGHGAWKWKGEIVGGGTVGMKWPPHQAVQKVATFSDCLLHFAKKYIYKNERSTLKKNFPDA